MAQRINSAGYIVRRGDPAKTKKTFVVLGVPRGGTSMTSGILRLSGIFMGNVLDPDNNEDQEFLLHKGNFLDLLDSEKSAGYIEGVRGIIKKRSESNDVWGWKDPLSILYIERLLDTIVNPHFILVTRDITAIAMREKVEFTTPFHDTDTPENLFCRKLGLANMLYQKSLDFLSKNEYPFLAISYERSLRHKKNAANLIMEFCDTLLEESYEETLRKIEEYITPDRLTGNLNHRSSTECEHNLDIPKLLVGLNSVDDVYGKAADLVNTGKYEQALEMCSIFDFIFRSGIKSVPLDSVSEVNVLDLFCASRFIAAISFVNLGDPRSALKELLIYSGISENNKFQDGLKISKRLSRDVEKLINDLWD